MEIIEIFNSMDLWLEEFLLNAGLWTPILSTILVFLEGILAFLPLFVFVTVNILSLSTFCGEILGTIIGIITGEITLFFALGGVIGIVASTIISISNKFIKE